MRFLIAVSIVLGALQFSPVAVFAVDKCEKVSDATYKGVDCSKLASPKKEECEKAQKSGGDGQAVVK